VIEAGTAAPEFELPNHRGEPTTLADLARPLLLCFYPNDFSPACSDQLSAYQRRKPDFDSAGLEVVGVSVDGSWSHNAFRKAHGLEFTLLSDFHPKGEMARRYGAYLEDWGTTNRSVVLIDSEGTVRWVHEMPTPVEFPAPEVLLDAVGSSQPL
jgi:peroxiredoxin